MNISLNKSDNVNGIITIEIERADFQESVNKSLNEFRRKATVPGFRQGKIPMGVVKKLHGASVLSEEVNKLINTSLSNYIQENKLPLLGEPLPKENLDKELDLEKDEKFTFDFEVGLAPELNMVFDKNDTLPYYKVKLEKEKLDQQLDSYKQNFGTYVKFEESALETDLIKGTVVELENGEPKEGGIVVEEAILMPSYIKKDEETKNRFVGTNAGDEVIINPSKAYDNESEIASFLGIPKEEVAAVTSDFKFTIAEITRFKEAELNQELFDKVLGEGVVTDEEAFKNKIEESLNNQFVPDADYLFMKEVREVMLEKLKDLEFPEEFLKRWLNQELFDKVLGEGVVTDEEAFKNKIEESLNNQFVPDADYLFMKEVREVMLEKLKDLEFPEEFLKRWLKLTNEAATDELIEKDFPNILNDIKYQLAKEKIVKDNEIKTEASDVQELAAQVAQMQFAQYGMNNLPVDMLQDYVKRMLEKEETVNGLVSRVVENKIAAWLKENVTIEEKEITADEFTALTAQESESIDDEEETVEDAQEVEDSVEKEEKEEKIEKKEKEDNKDAETQGKVEE